MSSRFGVPRPGAAHHDFRDVRVQHGGVRCAGTYHMADGYLIVRSAWGSASEPIRKDVDPSSRAAELLRAMIAGQSGAPDDPVGF